LFIKRDSNRNFQFIQNNINILGGLESKTQRLEEIMNTIWKYIVSIKNEKKHSIPRKIPHKSS
jgi:hypothetical protein